MGGRGSFISVDTGDFTFVEGGQKYFSIGEVNGIKIIERTDNNSVSAPFYSHSPNSVYAVVQDGILKYIRYYDENHEIKYTIDYGHNHQGLKPHVHIKTDHENGYKLTEDQENITKMVEDKIKKIYGGKK